MNANGNTGYHDHVEKISTMPDSQIMQNRLARVNLFGVDFALRLLLLATSIVGILVMVTGKQTELVPVPMLQIAVSRDAKFNYSPAFIYFVVALSVAALYCIVSLLISLFAISNPYPSSKLLCLLACFDSLMAGVVASATGAAFAVAYIGKKGNSHVGWGKICGVFDKYCNHVSSSMVIALIASIVLVLLVVLSTYSLYRRSH